MGLGMVWCNFATFDDPFALQTAISTADLELLPTEAGPFHGEMTKVCMDRLLIQRFYQSLPLLNAGAMKPGRRVLAFLTSSPASMRHCGTEVSFGDIIVNNFDEIHQQTEAGFRLGSMSMTTGDLDAACRAITGQEFVGILHKHIVRPSAELMSCLLTLHELVGQMARVTPDLLAIPAAVRSIEQQLINVMVRCLTEGAPSQMTHGELRHGIIIARLEEYLESRLDRAVYLAELCAAIGVSERTLRNACEEHLGMGPIRYLTLRRMHTVRRALMRATPSTHVNVTRIATDHGFWELGRFSVAYRNLFGETPSLTLRRSTDQPKLMLNRPSGFA